MSSWKKCENEKIADFSAIWFLLDDLLTVDSEKPFNGYIQHLGINRKLIVRDEPCADLDPADAVPFDDDPLHLHLGGQIGLG